MVQATNSRIVPAQHLDTEKREGLILKPLGKPGWGFFLFSALALLGTLWWFQAWAFQLQEGLIVSSLADWGTSGGVPWGVYVGSFIWWVGIAHGGIIISAAVRLFKLHVFLPITRIAELLTAAALSMAGLYIIIHLGRPDRMVTSIIPYFFDRIHWSPLIWDVTVITLYFILSATYLLLSLREDIYYLQYRLPKMFAPLYKLLLISYDHKEKKKIEQMLWWLAFAVIILAPLLLHGGVIPWLFQVLPSMPSWNSAVQGPQFLSIALTSAVGGIIFLAAVFRKAFGWKDVIPDKTFHRLGGVLALFCVFFLWLQLQQIVTGSFAAGPDLARATEAKVTNLLYWVSMGSVILVMVYLGAQTIFPAIYSLSRTVTAGLLVVFAVYLEKVLFVVEGLAYPAFNLYEGVPGHYIPSWVEVASIIGAISMVALMFIAFAKTIPVVEVIEEKKDEH